MRFKEDFLRELSRRLKENMEIIESSFELAGKPYSKNKLLEVVPLDFHLSILLEDDPYLFLGKLIYAIVNRQEIRVSSTNIACDLLLELVNLILEEFKIERIDRIGK